MAFDNLLSDWRQRALGFESALQGVMVGMHDPIRLLLVAVFARGHVLLEGDVGVGKTTLLRALARGLGGHYERVEGTIDMMPADLLYHTYVDEQGRPRVEPGPLIRWGEDLATFFFNEINRARPQVHSTLLRVMAERSVHAFNREYRFPHLLVFADRNRVEREETFELPAAARDRFLMELAIEAPSAPAAQKALMFDTRFHDVDRLIDAVPAGLVPYAALDALAVSLQQSVHVSAALQDYVLALWNTVRHPDRAGLTLPGIDVASLVAAGGSPRGMSFLVRAARVHAWLAGRDMVVPEDVQRVFGAVVAHRVFLTPIHEARRERILPLLLDAAFAAVPAP
ncbi:MAG: AAA family ATPase [Gammaproteobacteria bacterium]